MIFVKISLTKPHESWNVCISWFRENIIGSQFIIRYRFPLIASHVIYMNLSDSNTERMLISCHYYVPLGCLRIHFICIVTNSNIFFLFLTDAPFFKIGWLLNDRVKCIVWLMLNTHTSDDHKSPSSKLSDPTSKWRSLYRNWKDW